MLVIICNMFKTFIIILFLKFMFHYSALSFCNRLKVYYLALLCNMLKFCGMYIYFLKRFDIALKCYYSPLLERLNFLCNFKKYAQRLNILNFFKAFYMLKLYRSACLHISHFSKKKMLWLITR